MGRNIFFADMEHGIKDRTFPQSQFYLMRHLLVTGFLRIMFLGTVFVLYHSQLTAAEFLSSKHECKRISI